MNEDFEAYCEVMRRSCLTSTLVFTQKMFWAMNKHEYIVGEHHRLICSALDDVVRGNITKLIINIAPRYGKTLLVSQMFQAYGFAVNPQSKFIHLSYSGSLAMDNSVAVRDIVQSPFFATLFDARVKFGSAQKAKWDTVQGGGLYATTTLGQITGFGAGVTDKSDDEMMDAYSAAFNPARFAGAIVIDDPIKPEDALSDVMREAVNRRFESTIRNRVNSRKTPIVIIMQRLHEHDLCGYLKDAEPDEWTVLSLPCLTVDDQGNEHALWEHKHTVEELHHLQEVSGYVYETQYQQNPTPIEGLMYREFNTYEDLPFEGVNKCYCDTADTGADYLCAIFYRESKGYCYVTDVLYTKKPMEYTEPMMAEMCFRNNTTDCVVESNNGGRGFMRNVERLARAGGNSFTRFIPLTQTKNKAVRIFTQSNDVNNVVVFPKGWERAWSDFAVAVKTYRKEGGNAHDDACLAAGTMVATIGGNKPIEAVRVGDRVITPFGVRKVIASGCTGTKQVTCRFGLTATMDHHVYDNGLFIDFADCGQEGLSMLSLKELIQWRYRKLLFTTGSNTGSWGREGITSASREPIREGSIQKDFMWRFGKMLTEGKFLKAIAFTIRTATLSTTTSATWSVYRLRSIFRTMAERTCRTLDSVSGAFGDLTRQGRKPASGTEAPREGLGTANTQRASRYPIRILFARIAGSISSPSKRRQCSAVTDAESNTGASSQHTSACASNAARCSGTAKESHPTGTGNSVASHAGQPTPTFTEVFNIKVEKDGCFYANGILVSNCDALTGVFERMDRSSLRKSGLYW